MIAENLEHKRVGNEGTEPTLTFVRKPTAIAKKTFAKREGWKGAHSEKFGYLFLQLL